ncbi:MAG: hypothetical protein ACXWMJ_06420, partial [Syntrophales bacterium]
MKNGRVVFTVFGIVVLMFVIAPYVSAQGVWFKGKGSLKGYEVNYQVGTDIIVGRLPEVPTFTSISWTIFRITNTW